MEEVSALRVSLTLSAAEFKKGMQDVNNRMKIAQSEFKLAGAGLKDFGKSMDGMKAKSKYLEESLQLQKEKVETLRQRYEDLKSTKGEDDAATQRALIAYNNSQAAMARMESELQQTNEQIRLQSSQWYQLGERLTAVGDKFKAVGDKMKDVGKELSLKVTAPIMAFGAAGVAASKDYNDSFNTVIKKTGATGKAAEELEKSFKKVIANGPDSFADVGQAVGEVNTQFGFLGATLEDMSDLMLQFATINGQDVTSTSIAAKQAIEAYGLANSDLEYILDGVTKASQETGQSTTDLFDKTTAAAPQIKALGLNFVEGASLMAHFEKSGVDSSAAIASLSKATVVFAKDGKTLQQGLSETIKKITESKSETEALTLASEIFGSKGASRMVDAIKRGTFAIDDFVAAGEGIGNTVRKTFEQTLKPTDQAAIAMNNIKLAMADVGNAIQVALMPFLQKATEKLKMVAEWFGKLSPESKKTILVFAGIAAAIGPLLVIIGTLISSIGSIVGAFAPLALAIAEAGGLMAWLAPAFAVLTGPIGLIVLAIGGLIAAFVGLWKNNEDFRNKVIEIWESIKNAFFTAITFISENVVKPIMTEILSFAGDILSKLQAFWNENGQAIMTIVTTVFSGIWDYLKMVFGFIKGIFEITWPIIVGIVKIAWSQIKILFSTALDIILGTIQFFAKLFTGDWQGAFNTAKETAEKIMGNIKKIFQDLDLAKIGKDIIQGLLNGLGSMVGAVKDKIQSIAKLIPQGMKDFLGIKSPSRVMRDQVGKWIPEGIAEGISGNLSTIKSAVNQMSLATVPTSIPVTNMPLGQINPVGNQSSPPVSSASQQPLGPIIIQSVLNGRVIAEETYSDISRLINSANKFGGRGKGVVML